MRIIDFHTHAFPDKLAERAVPQLAREGNIQAFLDGKTSSLLASMDKSGIEKSVICSIATRPEQFNKILQWSKDVASDRLIPFPSVHPADPDAPEHIRQIRDEGFKGVKVHPYYQDFYLDEPRMDPLYAAIEECGLILVSHTGFDIAFPRDRRCDAPKILQVVQQYPGMKFVATHLGAWEDWELVDQHLIGKNVYVETSFSAAYLGPDRTRRMIEAHPSEHVLFGSDSPWADQQEEIERVLALGLEESLLECLFSRNALSLLGLP